LINLALLLLKWFLLILLYVFLIVTVFVVYKELKEPSSGSAKAKSATSSSAKIVILKSPGEKIGETFFLDNQIVIGRSSESDIEISDTSVSHQHASILRDGKTYKLEDLGSKNGTYLNQRRIAKAARLKHGDIIEVGKTAFEFMEK
jgi:pSer/pThr/pTyr-binding forkhead associated (FHA) protein